MNRQEVLVKASALIDGARHRNYGPANKNFDDIARIWSVLRDGSPDEVVFNGVDVAMFMIATKLARLMKSPNNPDHWVDIAGYAALGAEIATMSGEGDNNP